MSAVIPLYLVFFLFIVTTVIAQPGITEGPQIYGGGCSIIKDKLYYIGGVKDKSGDETSDKVFQLDLKNIKLNDSSLAPYTEVEIKPKVPKLAFSNMAKSTVNDNQILIYGGRSVGRNESFWIFDSSTSTMVLDPQSQGWPGTTNNEKASLSSPKDSPVDYFSTFVNNPLNKDEYILYGGYLNDRNIKDPHFGAGRVSIYNIKNREWYLHSREESIGIKLYDHVSVVNNDKMYVLGGKMYNGAMMTFSKLFIYQILSDNWITQELTGDIPSDRVGHSVVFLNNKFILSGGSGDVNKESIKSDIFSLDLETWIWTKQSVTGFRSTGYRGCAQLLDDGIILYSFGYSENIMPITQLLDTNNMRLVTSYSQSKDSSGGLHIASIVVPILIVLLLISLAIWAFKKYGLKNRNQNENTIELSDRYNDDPINIKYSLDDYSAEWLEDTKPVENRKEGFF